ncbi:hypothetical protein HDV02_004587 [Globomyces sp. JEL0801]|nr:hypothetical protein HDV02_004587 [Globomyces sp. JEL0801]
MDLLDVEQLNREDAIISPFYYTKHDLCKTVIERGLSLEVEQSLTFKNTTNIIKIAKHLGLPYYSLSTTLYLYHRFCAAHFIGNFKSDLVFVACFSLAMKIEETVKKLIDIYIAVGSVVHGKILELDQKDMREVKDKVINLERLLLEDIQFDVEIISPHRIALSYCLEVDGPQEIAEECWHLINSSYQSTVCIQYPPHIISLAALCVAFKYSYKSIPVVLLDAHWLADQYCAATEIINWHIILAETDDEKLRFGKFLQELNTLVKPIEPEVINKVFLEKTENGNSSAFDKRYQKPSFGRDRSQFVHPSSSRPEYTPRHDDGRQDRQIEGRIDPERMNHDRRSHNYSRTPQTPYVEKRRSNIDRDTPSHFSSKYRSNNDVPYVKPTKRYHDDARDVYRDDREKYREDRDRDGRDRYRR